MQTKNDTTNCLIPGQKYCQQENKTKKRKTRTENIGSDVRRKELLHAIDSDVNYSSHHGNYIGVLIKLKVDLDTAPQWMTPSQSQLIMQTAEHPCLLQRKSQQLSYRMNSCSRQWMNG